MDPVSIIAGVIALLTSLASLSFKLSELRNEFQDPISDIPRLAHEFDDLTQIFKRLEDTQKIGINRSSRAFIIS